VFLYTAGSMIDLGTLGGDSGTGHAINDGGEITGQSDAGGGSALHAFLYSAGTMTDLGTNGDDFGVAYGINNRGQMAINAYDRGVRSRAFIYDDGVMTDIGSLGGSYTAAYAINATGAITGISETADREPRVFLYAAGTMIDLGQPGAGVAVNDHGHVVGETTITRAFLHAHGTPYDLTALVVEGLAPGEWLAYAGGINNAGQIAATATVEGFQRKLAYRLDPVPLAVEYHHSGDDRYFVTASPMEIAALDAAGIAGWRRTGEAFGVYPLSVRDGAAVCQFQSASTFTPGRSRFYTPYAAECAALKVDPDWVFDGEAFATRLPDPAGGCRDTMIPLYRLYNGGKGGAPNHRYTTSATVRSDMVAKGWIPEGVGGGVIGCVLPP
jgi:probable HAF family extracellular repeat protein